MAMKQKFGDHENEKIKILECMRDVIPVKLTEEGKRTRVKLVNERKGEIRIKNAGDWTYTLSMTMKYGWNPKGTVNRYQTHGAVICEDESLIIAAALGKVIAAFQNNIENLKILIEFLKKGTFQIELEKQKLYQ